MRSARILAAFAALMSTGSLFAEEREWIIAPYIWAADVGLDLAVGGEPALGAEVPFSNIIDKLDTAFMGHFETRKGRWGGYIDTIGLRLVDQSTQPVGPGGPILGDLTIDSSLEMSLYEIAGLYRFGDLSPEATSIDLLFGLRHVSMDTLALITLPGPAMNQVEINTGPTETDVLIGVRISGNFSERWYWRLRGDTSFGGTEGTVNADAAVGYGFGKTQLFSLDLGYRYMGIEMKGTSPGDVRTDLDLTLSGPVLGFVFKF